MMEQILQDMASATDLRAIILRYFNPIGSDPDLESGIYAKEPSHVLGQLVMVARDQRRSFTITGTEHPTRDGTGIRDYIHVWDLARAHVRAIEKFDQVLAAVDAPSTIINVGTGSGVTVRELVDSFEKLIGRHIPITEAPPRPGDAVGAFANVDRARGCSGGAPSSPSATPSPRRWLGAISVRRCSVTNRPPGIAAGVLQVVLVLISLSGWPDSRAESESVPDPQPSRSASCVTIRCQPPHTPWKCNRSPSSTIGSRATRPSRPGGSAWVRSIADRRPARPAARYSRTHRGGVGRHPRTSPTSTATSASRAVQVTSSSTCTRRPSDSSAGCWG